MVANEVSRGQLQSCRQLNSHLNELYKLEASSQGITNSNTPAFLCR
jgi:hypothetical protein